jgi:Zinc dependent phospholipase C
VASLASLPPSSVSRRTRAIVCVVAVAGLLLLRDTPTTAYSVLAHQGTVDAAWDDGIEPLLRQRFQGLTASEVATARAYAYGGSLIQDLGYYPFGSKLFSNLTHYVRSGDFVESLIRGASNANEYAFALGALAHYASDNAGHPLAVNRAVPLMYPKLRAEVGDTALYIDSPARHIMVEFAFDVLQVARGAYAAQAYRDRIGFEVSKPLLERAVRDTYGLELDDLLLNVDLAIGTYRRAVSTTIPELTRIAWRDKREEIEQRTPGVSAQSFVYVLSRQQYEKEFGDKYKKPGIFARVVAFVLKIVPKIGPMRPLAFEPLTAEAERLFVDSVAAARKRYLTALESLRERRLDLANTDFETGRPPAWGANRLADETHADLLHELAKRDFAGVTPQLRKQLSDVLSKSASGGPGFSRREQERIRRELTGLNGQ